MLIYLPIAELPLNILLLLMLGGLGGVLAGMFGIGGGFLLTPLLIFLGVPPPVAVASSTNQIIASSVSGFLAHWKRNNVDIKMGLFLLAGGIVGSSLGVWLFAILKKLGQIDLVISLTYVIFLGTIGAMMGVESYRTIQRQKRGIAPLRPIDARFRWLKELPLPFQTHFPHSDLRLSLLLPIGIGAIGGMLVSLMGIGGGFIMIPAMIYILGMPTAVVVGTSLFQIIFTTSNATLLQAINTQSVDIVLSLLLIIGGVFGAQLGTKLGMKLPAEKLRGLLSLMVVAVCLRLALGLFLTPKEFFTLTPIEP